MTSGDPAPELRVGDRERRATDDRLRAALDDGVLTLVEYDERTKDCWAARTQHDLDVLVADLPEPAATPLAAPTLHDDAAPPAPRPFRERERPRLGKLVIPAVVLAVVAFGGVNVLGAADGASVFGSRTVTVAQGQDQVQVASLFGSTEVVVPDGVTARTTGLMMFGSVNCEQACALPPGAPTTSEVVVDANGGFGSVDVVTQSEAARGGIDQDHGRGDRDDDNN
jgi:Domain of unknown function (DUF1707)